MGTPIFGNEPTQDVFSIGNGYSNNGPSIAYLWTSIPGYSAFGSYTGNNSTDGPFIYTGFTPAFVLIKSATGSTSWYIYDSTRNQYNPADTCLFPNLNQAEVTNTAYTIDFLSNGFKLRTNNSAFNGSGSTYIYAAFAENPFGGNNVSPANAR